MLFRSVYTSSPQLFNVGQTAVNLEWKTPGLGKLVSYPVHARAIFYGKSFETDIVELHTFPSSKTVSLAEPTTIQVITDKNGTVVAHPSILYASNNEENLRYRVISPDGMCVIGGSESCLVTESTVGLLGNIKSITIDNQVYRVRYSGQESALERFSITSLDPIVGQWTVELDSEDGLVPQAHAMKDAVFKVKYRAEETPFVTEPN